MQNYKPDPQAAAFKVCRWNFFRKDRRWAILLAPLALNPGVIAVVSTYVAVNTAPLFIIDS